MIITTEVPTTIATPNVFVDLLGTYSVHNLTHFDNPANGQLRHLGDSPREFRIFISSILECTANDEVELKIVVWDNSESVFVDFKSVRRVINNLQGGRNVAFVNVIDGIILDQNDYVKIQVANINAINPITVEVDSEFVVEAR